MSGVMAHAEEEENSSKTKSQLPCNSEGDAAAIHVAPSLLIHLAASEIVKNEGIVVMCSVVKALVPF